MANLNNPEDFWGPSPLRATYPAWLLGEVLFRRQQEHLLSLPGRKEPEEEADEPIVVDA